MKVLQRDLGRVENRLLDLQTEQHALEARVSTPLSASELAELATRLNEIGGELSVLEDRWLTLSEQIDTATRPLPS